MTNIRSIDDYIARIFAGVETTELLDCDTSIATTTSIVTGQVNAMNLLSCTFTFPSLPSGVTAFMIPLVEAVCSAGNGAPLRVGKLVHLGKLDIATNVYTADATMPTYTEGGVSNQTYSPVFGVINTALNATPGALQITYNASDGTTGNTNVAQSLSNSAVALSAGVLTLNASHWGVSAITGAVRAAGTSPTGIIDFYGWLPLCTIHSGYLNACQALRALHYCSPYRFAAGDVLGVVAIVTSGVRRTLLSLRMVGDT